ncbi:hypothetical protein GCM10009193_27100 [Shewanella aestuarii]|nr:hypothetical protein GCM10009193_27100 [Shewanella aestuarii]
MVSYCDHLGNECRKRGYCAELNSLPSVYKYHQDLNENNYHLHFGGNCKDLPSKCLW